jgi:ABC-type lipoprotein export system ATPase subunit
VLETLRALNGATILIATHDPLLAREADQVIVLDRGHIASGVEPDQARSSGQATHQR